MKTLPLLKPLSSILVKPTGADCNIDCTYCFYLDRAGVVRPGFQNDGRGFDRLHGRAMSAEVQEEMIRQMMRDGGRQVSFGWQGGEPTLMGLDFFKRAVSLQKQYGANGQSVGNGLQTNGLSIDDDWCDFLRETHWLVGLSIDGPPHVHDHYRVTRNGKPTYEMVKEAAERMSRKKVEYNALTVVNNYSAQYAREIYEHHKKLGIEFMQFIPCVETDPFQPDRAAEFSVSALDYGKFLCEIFDCWKADFKHGKPTTSVRYIDSVFHTYVGMQPPECTLLNECGCYVVVEHNGDVYSCDFFVESDWKLGNVMESRLIHLLNSEKQKEFGLLKADMPEECGTCDYQQHCYGGCTKDRIRDPADQGSNHFCKSYLQFFDHADGELKRLAAEWRAEQQRFEQEALAEQRRQAEMRRQAEATRVASPPKTKVSRNDPCPCGSGKKFKRCCGR
ncbi:MAG: anaerobic sulfatase maturase [Candidatus Omnitrophica bacterium]|nr:anaerobic sulfatase maturase [Candidatus Omnitrophota bacterium]